MIAGRAADDCRSLQLTVGSLGCGRQVQRDVIQGGTIPRLFELLERSGAGDPDELARTRDHCVVATHTIGIPTSGEAECERIAIHERVCAVARERSGFSRVVTHNHEALISDATVLERRDAHELSGKYLMAADFGEFARHSHRGCSGGTM